MKKYLLISTGFACILAMALMTTGCGSYYNTGYSDGYYDSNYGHGYGDGHNYYYTNNQRPLGFNDFYHQLSPYGSWVNLAPYGQVWVANVPNFQPYSTNGYWAYTTYGWTWVSNYSWGWAPFHYGRWGFNNRFGWYWVPGYEWGPAWVVWGSGSNSMYGWAPLMPGMNFGVSLSMNLFPSNYWTFMPSRYMGMNNIGNYYVNRSQNVTIINNTTIINNYGTENNGRYSMGPSASDVQRQTGRTVQPMRVTNVSDNSRSGVSDNELRVYRPVTRSAAESSSDNSRSSSTGSSDNNRVGTSSTRSAQPATQQDANRAGASQTRSPQPVQQSTNSQTRSAQPAQQDAGGQRSYQQAPAQPRVTNNAAPQTNRQIQAAQSESSRTQQQQQQRSTTSSSSSSSRSGSDTQSRR